jgi:hypothetical protein
MDTDFGGLVGNAEVIQKRAWRKSFADLLEDDFWPGIASG